MRTFDVLLLAICFIAKLDAGPASNDHRSITLDLRTASCPVLDAFGDPTLGGTQVWSPRFSSLIGDSQQTTIPIEQEAGSTDAFVAYVYRRGCKVALYQVDDVKNDSLHRNFECELAVERPITVTIQNLDVLNSDELFARIYYTGPWRCLKTPSGICNVQAVHFTVGVFPIASNGRFTFPMPDFGNDPKLLQNTASNLEKASMLREASFDFVIGPLRGGASLGHLVIGDPKLGTFLRVAKDYSSELDMTLVPER